MKILIFVMMVEHSPHHHNDEGSSPANTLALGGIKWQKCFYALANNSVSVLIIPAQQILEAENGRNVLNIWTIFFHNLISFNLA
jgi:hypothetical protein